MKDVSVNDVRGLVRRIQDDPQLPDKIMTDAKIAREEAQRFDLPDTMNYRAVIVALGAALLLAVMGGIFLAYAGPGEVPDILIATASGALGALAGLLSPR